MGKRDTNFTNWHETRKWQKDRGKKIKGGKIMRGKIMNSDLD
jgi:hypothetical protein